MTSRYSVNYQLKSHKRDQLIEFIKSLLLTPFILTTGTDTDTEGRRMHQVFQHVEALIAEHIQHQSENTSAHSRLYRFVPSIGKFFSPLPLANAFLADNKRYRIDARRFIPPSFNDIRRILNTAQVMAIRENLKLITFDGDVTLYEDGENLTLDSPIVPMLISLLKANVHVAIVTAAGYTQADRYEQRLHGLLEALRGGKSGLSNDQMGRLYVVGGECNYLLNLKLPDVSLQYQSIPNLKLAVTDDDVTKLLDIAQDQLGHCIRAMNLSAKLIRKEKAVGMIPSMPSYVGLSKRAVLPYQIEREQLDECVVSTQVRINLEFDKLGRPSPPFCSFNGGRDVWIDVGNKLIGVSMLQELLGCQPADTLHVGDQFLSTGNDIATRSACCTVWIASPTETMNILDELLSFKQPPL